MDDVWTDLDATRRDVWRRLQRGVADRRAAARHPVLATQGRAGWPEARTVVLRRVSVDAATVEIHTDTASAKIADLDVCPRASLMVWDPKADLQIRLRLRMETLTVAGAGADLVSARWAAIPEAARRPYGTEPAPGQPIPAPEAVAHTPRPERFAVLLGHVEEIETLHLGPDRHRRAVFARGRGWVGQWLSP
ncbi:MAG: pyridoxamine 5'-phosphate oxidase family protein [Paracoccaceae bacterium]